MANTTAAHRSGRIILASILAIFVYGMIAATLGTVMPNLPLNIDQKATLPMAQAAGLIIASLAAGPFVDNKGKKAALVTALALISIALFYMPNAGGYGGILFAFLLLNLGGGILVTAANALVSDVNEERRAATLNMLNLFFGLGLMATPYGAAKILQTPSSLLYGAAILATITFLVHATTKMPPPSGERGFKMSEAGTVLGRPALWLLGLLLFLYVGVEVSVSNWLAQYLIFRGVDRDTAFQILALGFGFGILLGRVVVSRVLIRVAAPTVTLASAILMAVTTYLMLQADSPAVAWVAVFFAGVAMAPVFPTTLGMVGDAFPKATATAMGIVITFGWVGLAVSSNVIKALSGGEESRLGTALLVLPVASVLMIVVNLALRPMLRKA